MKYLVDANVLVHTANRTDGWRLIVTRIDSMQPRQRMLSAIAEHEIRYMLAKKKAGDDGRARPGALLSKFSVAAFDAAASKAAAAVRVSLGGNEQNNQLMDMLQAGHAKAKDWIFATDDNDFSRIPGLKTENWRRPAKSA